MTVPRAPFIPDLAWAYDQHTRASEPVDRRVDPERWLAAVESDTPLTIQWDDGNHEGAAPGQLPTSSSSQPSVVDAMLADADLTPGLTVLEVGTATGWSAARTAELVGPGRVVTVEIDPAVAATAAKALAAYGADVLAVCGDGTAGFPARAPFDRVIVTAGTRRIPAAWIVQTRPGGRIVAPWGTPYTYRDALAVLTVREEGTAAGRFTGPVEFMKIRSQRGDTPVHSRYVPDGMSGARESRSALPAGATVSQAWGDPSAFVTGLLVPSVARTVDSRDPDAPTVWLYSLTDLSWAVAVQDGNGSDVWQDGPRSLWDEVETAHDWWTGHGRPDVERFGITADGASETAWLDDPSQPLSELQQG